VSILPVKVLDCAGSGDSLSLAQGILYAAKSGARVINVSLGGQNDSIFVSEAVRVARAQYGALVVAASGNTGGVGVAYPARYAETLAVGAATGERADTRASFSTSGPEVDVVAVGQRVVGTVPPGLCNVFLPCIGNEPYGMGDGTSFSAPQVAGLVALILSRRPSMTPDALIALVKQTAHGLPAGDRPDWAGAGRIDMLGAIRPQFQLGAPGVSRN
jgi:subtilisin family serine protease